MIYKNKYNTFKNTSNMCENCAGCPYRERHQYQPVNSVRVPMYYSTPLKPGYGGCTLGYNPANCPLCD